MSDEYVKVQTPNNMKKQARYLRGKLSYQGNELLSRISRQQIMVGEQGLKTRKSELEFLNDRSKLIRFQTDLEIMFLVQDMNRKKKK